MSQGFTGYFEHATDTTRHHYAKLEVTKVVNTSHVQPFGPPSHIKQTLILLKKFQALLNPTDLLKSFYAMLFYCIMVFCFISVETPTWRFNKITNLYQLEGTEVSDKGMNSVWL